MYDRFMPSLIEGELRFERFIHVCFGALHLVFVFLFFFLQIWSLLRS